MFATIGKVTVFLVVGAALAFGSSSCFKHYNELVLDKDVKIVTVKEDKASDRFNYVTYIDDDGHEKILNVKHSDYLLKPGQTVSVKKVRGDGYPWVSGVVNEPTK